MVLVNASYDLYAGLYWRYAFAFNSCASGIDMQIDDGSHEQLRYRRFIMHGRDGASAG